MSVWDVVFSPIHKKLNTIIHEVRQLHQQGEQLMATMKDVQAAVQKLDDATNAEAAQLDAVQTELDALKQQIAGGVSSSEAQAVVDSLSSISDRVAAASDRLKQMATDPTNPVPVPTPPV